MKGLNKSLDSFQNNQTTNSLDYYGYPSETEIFVMYFLSTGAFLANLTVFYVVPKLRGKIKSSTRYAMLNLAITDCLLGFGSLILRTIYLVNPQLFLEKVCIVDGLFTPYLVSLSIMGLAFLSLDKFLNLAFPLRYKIWMTGKKTLIILASMWVFYIAVFGFSVIPPDPLLKPEFIKGGYICFPNYVDNKLFTVLAIVFQQLLPSIVCIASLVGMCTIVRKSRTHLREGQSKAASNERTLVFMIFLLNCTYFIMYMPFFIFVIFWGMVTGSAYSSTASFISLWLGGANSVVNPLIYIPSLRSYRYHLKMAFCRQRQRRDSQKPLKDISENSSSRL